ncbi:hypothetical protein FHR92_004394 [Fontibacillus solani]|uniref:DUF1349 domain-containing protein n=1 Tax=Fontibacillus solani TaxID=1572857 RepID=A0A7W3SX66_9BACL|nr:DUF1349 domain-containing protein [Fontibacillus solani]MBA9087901.1 hypothetical protein [Fontibacillus solani]
MEILDFDGFKWLNESNIRFDGEKIVMYAPAKSDFFCSDGVVSEGGIIPESLDNAPFFYTEVSGDFVMRVKVQHDFKDIYDSASIMVMKDKKIWGKLCFEYTDFRTRAVVSVVTNQISDDANGVNVEEDSIWLQIARVGKSFAFHYSFDGNSFYMARFFNLPVDETVMVGLLPQAPTGEGGERIYSNFSLEYKTVKNIRVGD